MNDFVFDTENENNKLSAEKVQEFIRRCQEGVAEGNIDPLHMYHKFKNIEKTLKIALEATKKEALPMVQENPLIIKNGYEYKEKQGGKLWDFKGIPLWAEKKDELTLIEVRAKQNFAALNRVKTVVDEETGQLIDEETGEIFILPQVKHKENSIEIKPIKK